MRAFWRSVKEKMEKDPHFIPVMGIEAEGGKGSVEWIKFMDSPQRNGLCFRQG